MSDSNIFPLFAPAPTVADALRTARHLMPTHAAMIAVVTCVRDVQAIHDHLCRMREEARSMAAPFKDSDPHTYASMSGMAAGLNSSILNLERWLKGSTPAAAPLGEHTPEDYRQEDQTEAEYAEDRAALACTDCGQPTDWGRTAAGVCRRCHEDASRAPSEDTEGPSVRGH